MRLYALLFVGATRNVSSQTPASHRATHVLAHRFPGIPATATSSQRAPRERPESSLVAPNEQSILGISIVYIHTYSLVGPKEPYILGISTAYIHTYSLVALKEPYMLVHTYISS